MPSGLLNVWDSSKFSNAETTLVLKRIAPEGTTGCVVPSHDELAVGMLRGILKQAGVAVEDFMNRV